MADDKDKKEKKEEKEDKKGTVIPGARIRSGDGMCVSEKVL